MRRTADAVKGQKNAHETEVAQATVTGASSDRSSFGVVGYTGSNSVDAAQGEPSTQTQSRAVDHANRPDSWVNKNRIGSIPVMPWRSNQSRKRQTTYSPSSFK